MIIMMTNLCSVECKTRAGKPCVFPFHYKGTDHYACITDDNDGTPWCSTGYLAHERYWANETGNCMSDCPGKLVLTVRCDNDEHPLFSIM